MARLNIFVSCEFEKDNQLKGSFLAQAKRLTHHRIRNPSLSQDYPNEIWKWKANEAIQGCDVVIVMVGQDTHNDPGVRFETDVAGSLQKPTIQVLSRAARQQGFRGVQTIDDRIPWKWDVITARLDELESA